MENNVQVIVEFIRRLKFRKKMFNGVDERDVLKKINQLNQEYMRLFDVQESYFKKCLEEKDLKIQELEEKINELKDGSNR